MKFLRYSTLLLATLGAMACGSKAPDQRVVADRLVVFPPPPDTARVQFLARLSNSLDIEPQRGRSTLDKLLGREPPATEVRSIVKPYGLAIHGGRIYVCDTEAAAVQIIDLAGRTFTTFRPDGMGRLLLPINCVVSRSDGWLYVADGSMNRVVVFDSTLTYAGQLEGGPLTRPTDVAVSEDRIWVCDITGHAVHVYDRRTRQHLFSFPEAAPHTPAYLYSPTNIALGRDAVYVTDTGDFSVKVFDFEGAYVRRVGAYGMGFGQFQRPKGIAVDADERLYVVDAEFENVQLFDRDGALLTFFGGHYQGPGYLSLPAKVVVDDDNLAYFADRVHPSFRLEHLILVTNQWGPDRITVYGFVSPKAGAEPAP